VASCSWWKGIARTNPEREKGEDEVLFHVSAEIHPTVNLDDDKRVREVVGPQLQKMMESGKVREPVSLAARGEASSSSTSTHPKNSLS